MADQHYFEVGGVGLLVDLTGGDPVIVHWGAPLGAAVPDASLLRAAVPHSNFDAPIRPSVAAAARRAAGAGAPRCAAAAPTARRSRRCSR